MAIQSNEQNRHQLLLTQSIVRGYKQAGKLETIQKDFSRFILHEDEVGPGVAKYLKNLSENSEFEVTDEFSFEFTQLSPVTSHSGSVIFFNEKMYEKFFRDNKSDIAKYVDLSSRASDHSSVINEFIKMGFPLENLPYLLRFIEDTIGVINSEFFGMRSSSSNNNESNFFSDVSLDQKVQNIISALGSTLVGYEQYVRQYIAQHYRIMEEANFAAKVIDQIRYYLFNLHKGFASLLVSGKNYVPQPIEITNYYPWSEPEYFVKRKERGAPQFANTKAPFQFDGAAFEPPQTLESKWLKHNTNESSLDPFAFISDCFKHDQIQFEQTVTPASLNALSQLSLTNTNENTGQTQAEEQAPSPSQT